MMSILAFVLVASLFVPEASDRQVSERPLSRGEVAYIDIDGKNAKILVGSQNNIPFNVVDDSSLRGYEYSYLSRDQFAVTIVSNLTRVAENDTWKNESFGARATAVLCFGVPYVFNVDDIEIDVVTRGPSATDVSPIVKQTNIKSGNCVTVILEETAGVSGKIYISNPKVRTLKCGNPEYVNDLSTKKIIIEDSLGKYDLYDLRDWAQHLYDGNRGEDWSDYVARYDVKMGGFRTLYGNGRAGIYPLSIGQTGIDTNAYDLAINGRIAISFSTENGSLTTNGNYIAFSSISIRNANQVAYVDMGITNTIAGFSTSNLKLLYTKGMEDKNLAWSEVPYVVTTASPLVITAERGSHDKGFFMLLYGDSENVMDFCGKVLVHRLGESPSEVITENTADYALVTLTDGAFALASGQIGNYTTATNTTLTLNFSDVADRSGDCMLYVINSDTANDHTIDIAPITLDIVSTGDKPLTIAKATTNIVTFSRVKANTILISKQEVK